MWQGGANPDPRRRADRFQPENVRCPLGEVIDLSRVGMRITSKGKPPLRKGQVGKIRLGGPDGSVDVQARVVRMKRIGLRRYEIGLEFVNVKPGVREALGALAEFGFFAAAQTDPSRGRKRSSPRINASADLPDYYAVLGVSPDASIEEIHESYRALARRYHPDVSSEEDATTRFVEVQNAYAVLRDAERRRMYDMRDVA